MRALAIAEFTTKISGLPARSHMSTVAPTARKSCGLGRVGTTTSSATAITLWIAMVIAGGVSITASLKPWLRKIARSVASRATVVWANAGNSACRSFHQSASDACGSMSINTTGPAPARWAWTARCPDRVVLPEPPFCEASAKMRNVKSLAPVNGEYNRHRIADRS